MSFKYIKDDAEKWNRMFRHLNANDNYSETYTGMHVHMSRDAFTAYQIYKFCAFFNRRPNEEFLYALSGRIEPSSYAKRNYDRAVFISNARYTHDKMRWSKEWYDRYSWINLENSYTVELRLFGTPMTYDEMMVKLELCDAAFHYAKTAKMLSRFEFCSWLSTQNGYKRLKKAIENVYGKDTIFPKHAIRKVA
jgi:hypothetical protein